MWRAVAHPDCSTRRSSTAGRPWSPADRLYLYANPALEYLSPTQRQLIGMSWHSGQASMDRWYLSHAQRQLIGMAPDNQRRVQQKIRQIAAAVGLTDLPRPTSYGVSSPWFGLTDLPRPTSYGVSSPWY